MGGGADPLAWQPGCSPQAGDGPGQEGDPRGAERGGVAAAGWGSGQRTAAGGVQDPHHQGNLRF